MSGSITGIQKGWDNLLQKIVSKYEFPKPDESVQAKDITLNGFWVRVYTPPEGKNESDTVGVYFHGGGWALGSVDQEDALCRLICKHHRMTTVSVEYRLAPKFKYPIPLDDCVEAVRWSLSNLQAKSAVLIGASAGGNLAFGTALRFIEQGNGDLIKGVVALVPVTVHPDAVPESMRGRYTSYKTNADITVNTASAMKTFFEAYDAPADDKFTSCLLYPRLKDLRRVYIAECSADTLRDDARLMKEELESVGVPVTYDAYPGYPHYSWTFPSKHLDVHRQEFLGNAMNGIEWVKGANIKANI